MMPRTQAQGGTARDIGVYMRSQWEKNYARFLTWQGELWKYEAETFWFKQITRGTRSYTPDFWLPKKREYHEVKGWMTPKSKTQLDRMRRYYPEVKIVVIDHRFFRSIEQKRLCRLIPGWECAHRLDILPSLQSGEDVKISSSMQPIQNINALCELPSLLREGYITVRKHPTVSLYIYNYTAKAQYANAWNETTLTCRGLIVDGEGRVVSRPFQKFFTLEQIDSLPNEPFEVYEKLDGSLGILYWLGDMPYIATRGSFDGPQARYASLLLRKYDPALFDRRLTYLFEILYPENRIVVDYGDRCELVLLAVFETETGRELPFPDIGFSAPQRYDGVTDIETLPQLSLDNAEGFVVRFKSGLRVKVKLTEYLRLHRLLTGLSEKTILEEYLMTGADIGALVERVPDEFRVWVEQTVERFRIEYSDIEQNARQVFTSTTAATRKEYAAVFTQARYSAVLFKMLDGKNYEPLIWTMIKAHPRTYTIDRDGE